MRPAEPVLASPANRGLDWLNLFVANIQTGFGPFISVYLTAQGWTQTTIGLALSLGTITAMASQVPAGALVDAVPSKPAVVLCSVVAFSASALFFALWPVPLSVYAAEVIHGFSSCTLGPAVNAISLAVAGPVLLGLRLGRNARFASIGNGVGAALMGACGYYVSERAVFFLTALLTLPAIASLRLLRRQDAPRSPDGEAALRYPGPPRRERLTGLLLDRRLLIFAACAMLFTLANAALLPLAGSTLTKSAGDAATLLIAACIVLPQLIVAAISPTIGRLAQSRGRRWVLLLGIGAMSLRATLLALILRPLPLVAIQALDGIAASCFGVMVPLVVSDIAGRSGRYNLALGVVGLAMGLGATASTSMAGWIADALGMSAAFGTLALVGFAAEFLVWAAMPETRPQ